ncbi:MAG: ArsA family ATPase [Nocardia sp.]|nr:ArsA family ATPase [Nocardia sp.]
MSRSHPSPLVPAATPVLDIEAILDDRTARVIVCCGSGGVGKTTTAAAIALHAAERGRKVVVLTIDPARRLAQSLGVSDLGNSPQRVALPEGTKGELHAMMLNMRRTFDEMVLEHTSADKAEQIFANPFYQTVASSFGGTQEYMAMEKLGQLAGRREWDLIVVDTPPSRNALDFLDAPQRLGTFLNGRMIRVMMAPGRGVGRIVTGAMSLAVRGVSTIVGGQMLKDASAFLQSLESMFGGFQDRADRTYEMLSRPGTHFLVVAAAEPDALREASFFVDRLSTDKMPLAGLVLNRTHPVLCALPAAQAITAADRLGSASTNPTQPDESPIDAASLTANLLRIHAGRSATAKREQRLLHRFTGAHPRVPVIAVTALPFEVSDLEALRAVAAQLATTSPDDAGVERPA